MVVCSDDQCDVMVCNITVQCIPLVDDVVVEQLVPKLSELLKSGTGLTTKVCVYL